MFVPTDTTPGDVTHAQSVPDVAQAFVGRQQTAAYPQHLNVEAAFPTQVVPTPPVQLPQGRVTPAPAEVQPPLPKGAAGAPYAVWQ